MLSRLTLRTARGGGIEGVVFVGIDVAEIPHIGRFRFVIPPIATEQELFCGRAGGRFRERTASTRASRSGSRLPRKPRSASKRAIRRHPVMGVRVKRVVDGNARPVRPELGKPQRRVPRRRR